MKSFFSLLTRVNIASKVELSESLSKNSSENLLKKFIFRSVILTLAIFIATNVGVLGQTTLLSPIVANGGFESGSTNWTTVGTQANKWQVSTNATAGFSGTGSSYLWYTASTGGTSLSTSQGLTLGTTTYYLEVVGSNGCLSLTRTPVVVTEDPLLTASVSITGTTACPGGVLLFTSTPVNGGTNPTFQWYNNGVVIPNETASTYSASGLLAGDVINVKMIPSGSCVTVCL